MDDTLSAAQLRRLAAGLEARRSELRRDVRAQLDGSDDDRVVGLRGRLDEDDDWGVADGLAELDIAEVRHVLAELTAVDGALVRLRDGSYGTCIECDEPIATARLLAYSTAVRCIECQEAHEARARGPGAAPR
ncbi:MAG: TraR/DksA family transcriptional regulator [Casimicrobiaceae bacterium]